MHHVLCGLVYMRISYVYLCEFFIYAYIYLIYALIYVYFRTPEPRTYFSDPKTEVIQGEHLYEFGY